MAIGSGGDGEPADEVAVEGGAEVEVDRAAGEVTPQALG